jgi:hypothetical protein
MSHREKRLARLKQLELQPLPPSLEEAFEAVENLDTMHPSSRGQSFGSIIRPPDRAVARRMAHDER